MHHHFILIRGCRQHNLKNISVSIPKNQITLITGVSGSGKSSLAFDTLFAEGQRRYLEYLSSQARASIKQLPKPQVDLIEGLSPTLAIGQGRQSLYSRGTVATYTDLDDFLCLLYANIGEQHSPFTGKRLIRYSRQEIVDLILREYPEGSRLQLLAPIKLQKENVRDAIERLHQMGFIRLRINNRELTSDEIIDDEQISQLDVVVDRIEMKEGIRERLSGSVETALDLSQGILKIQEGHAGEIRYLTEIYVCPETSFAFAPLGVADFNFNSPHGACSTCQGEGGMESIHNDMLHWKSDIPLSEQIEDLITNFPKKQAALLHVVWHAFLNHHGIHDEDLVSSIKPPVIKGILEGSSKLFALMTLVDGEEKIIQTGWKGLIPLMEEALKDKKNRGHVHELPFVKWKLCDSCHGARLKIESLSCLIKGEGIHHLYAMTVSELIQKINSWTFKGKEEKIAVEILPHIASRLRFLDQVGLGYLELNRPGNTLSDGETQRIQLAAQIGVKLSGITYVLDEPSLGLHSQDIQHLHHIIQELKDLGNTVVIVEHERSLIKLADHLIEIGPGAGIHGGEVIFQGNYSDLLESPNSLTGKWLCGKLKFPKPPKRKLSREFLSVEHVNLHNLHDFSVKIPLRSLVGLCGVSGSGKSTLALDIIAVEMRREIVSRGTSTLLKGLGGISRLVTSEKQNQRLSTRSIPATYIEVMTPIRLLLGETKLAKARGYTPARFSLNKKGGRCEACEGQGEIRVSMNLMPDIFIPCEVCQGARYNHETLQVTWEGHSIAEILNLPVEKAYQIFEHIPSIAPKLQLMLELGLEYLTLGQPFNTLSSGEIQRLRLVADLGLKSVEPTLYILDEPSAGLHFHDVEKLLKILHRLIDKGHSVIVVEHHLDILQQADWLIEMGPGGGPQGGKVVFEGTVDKLKKAETPTGRCLRRVLEAE